MVAPGPAGDDARRPALEERPGLVQRAATPRRGRRRAAGGARPRRSAHRDGARRLHALLGVQRAGAGARPGVRRPVRPGPGAAGGAGGGRLLRQRPRGAGTRSWRSWRSRSRPSARSSTRRSQGFSGLAATTGIVGLVLLIWSASSLVRALDGAFRVVFEDSGEGRTPIRDVVAVAAVAGGTFAAAVVLVLVTLPGPDRGHHRGPRAGGPIAGVAARGDGARGARLPVRAAAAARLADAGAPGAGHRARDLPADLAVRVPRAAALRIGAAVRRVRRAVPGPDLAGHT